MNTTINKKPANPYSKEQDIILWSVFEGDWEDLPRDEIAWTLGTSESKISACFAKIKRETGYDVPRVRRRASKKPKEQDEQEE